MSKVAAIYIVTNKKNGTLYTGLTSDLIQRIWQHKQVLGKGFAAKYGCTSLVYYEVCDDILQAITREKQIKGGSRAAKIALIQKLNPAWNDLCDGLF